MPKYLDETGLAHFWDNIKKYTDNADAELTKNDHIATQFGYLFRVSPVSVRNAFSDSNYAPQGMCIDGNNIGYFAIAPTASNTATNVARIFKVPMSTKIVADYADLPVGHCNSMCYDTENDLIYITPNQVNGTAVTNLFVVDPSTMTLVNTYDIGITGRVIYDKATNKAYIANTSTIYSLDIETFTTEYICDTEISKVITSLSTDGFLGNGITCYDGIMYCTVGKDNASYIISFDVNDGHLIDVVNVPHEVGIYYITENQDSDFTADGALVVYAIGTFFNVADRPSAARGVVIGVNINGKTILPNHIYRNNCAGDCDDNGLPENSKTGKYSLASTGYNASNPVLYDISEAQAIGRKYGSNVVNLTGGTYSADTIIPDLNDVLVIRHVNSNMVVVEFDSVITFSNVYFEAYSNGNAANTILRKKATATSVAMAALTCTFRSVGFEVEEGAPDDSFVRVRNCATVNDTCTFTDKGSVTQGRFWHLNQSRGIVSIPSTLATSYPEFATYFPSDITTQIIGL